MQRMCAQQSGVFSLFVSRRQCVAAAARSSKQQTHGSQQLATVWPAAGLLLREWQLQLHGGIDCLMYGCVVGWCRTLSVGFTVAGGVYMAGEGGEASRGVGMCYGVTCTGTVQDTVALKICLPAGWMQEGCYLSCPLLDGPVCVMSGGRMPAHTTASLGFVCQQHTHLYIPQRSLRWRAVPCCAGLCEGQWQLLSLGQCGGSLVCDMRFKVMFVQQSRAHGYVAGG